MRVLLIGDSILMGYSNGPGYGQFVSAHFATLNVAVTTHQCADSGSLLNVLPTVVSPHAWDLIHFNCGLHDLKRDRTTGAVITPLERFADNMARICDLLYACSSHLIWASITPVHDLWHNTYKPFDRKQKDVDAYNRVAFECVSTRRIRVNDLHEVVLEQGQEKLQFNDGVHFTEAGSRVLANAVIDRLSTALAMTPKV